MPLTLFDFVQQVEDVTVDDIPDSTQDSIDSELADQTSGDGNDLNNPDDVRIVADTVPDLNGRAGFTSIQDAINGNNAENGAATDPIAEEATIFVEPGTYLGDLTLSTKGVTLQSAQGPGETTIRGDSPDGDDVLIAAENVTVAGFEILPSQVDENQADEAPNDRSVVFLDSVNSNVDGFDFKNNRVEIDESTVDSEYNNLVTTQFGSTVSDHLYEDNEFVATNASIVRQLVVNGGSSNPSNKITVRDNEFTGNVGNGVLLSVDASKSLIEDNTFAADTAQTDFALVGIGSFGRDSPAATGVTVQNNTFTDTAGSGGGLNVRYFRDNTGNIDLQADIISQNTFEPDVTLNDPLITVSQPTATVTFDDQTVPSGATSVNVASATFDGSEKFNVVVHVTDDTDGDGTIQIGEVKKKIGESVELNSGTATGIDVNIDKKIAPNDDVDSLTSSQTLIAMLHTTNTSDGDGIVHTAPIKRGGTPVFAQADITVD